MKETALSGCASTSASPSSPPEPATKLTTPFGMPASCSASTMRHALKRRGRGRLQHHGVAADQRRRQLPGRNRAREIPRRDQPHHADRLAQREHVDAVALGRHQHAGHARAFAGEVAEDVDGPPHLALGFGQRLAFLARHVGGHLLERAVQDVGDLVQDVAARRTAHARTTPGSAAAAASAASATSAPCP